MHYHTNLIAGLGLAVPVACALALVTLGLELGALLALAAYSIGGAATLLLSTVLLAARVEHRS